MALMVLTGNFDWAGYVNSYIGSRNGELDKWMLLVWYLLVTLVYMVFKSARTNRSIRSCQDTIRVGAFFLPMLPWSLSRTHCRLSCPTATPPSSTLCKLYSTHLTTRIWPEQPGTPDPAPFASSRLGPEKARLEKKQEREREIEKSKKKGRLQWSEVGLCQRAGLHRAKVTEQTILPLTMAVRIHEIDFMKIVDRPSDEGVSRARRRKSVVSPAHQTS